MPGARFRRRCPGRPQRPAPSSKSAGANGRASVLRAAPDAPDQDVGSKAPTDGDRGGGDALGRRVESPVAGQVDEHPQAESERHQAYEGEWEAQRAQILTSQGGGAIRASL